MRILIFQTVWHALYLTKKNDVEHWIQLEHTGENGGVGVIRWDTEQQDRFAGRRSRSVIVYDFADEARITRKNVDSTSLDRLLSTPTVCGAIGISFSDSELIQEKAEPEVRKNVKKNSYCYV